jgi:hypothetical protein
LLAQVVVILLYDHKNHHTATLSSDEETVHQSYPSPIPSYDTLGYCAGIACLFYLTAAEARKAEMQEAQRAARIGLVFWPCFAALLDSRMLHIITPNQLMIRLRISACIIHQTVPSGAPAIQPLRCQSVIINNFSLASSYQRGPASLDDLGAEFGASATAPLAFRFTEFRHCCLNS